jgi:hypothetical protein
MATHLAFRIRPFFVVSAPLLWHKLYIVFIPVQHKNGKWYVTDKFLCQAILVPGFQNSCFSTCFEPLNRLY